MPHTQNGEMLHRSRPCGISLWLKERKRKGYFYRSYPLPTVTMVAHFFYEHWWPPPSFKVPFAYERGQSRNRLLKFIKTNRLDNVTILCLLFEIIW